MTYFLQQSLNALQLGSIYALIALGYTMVYGILTMINFAHGDLFMVGAFFCFVAATVLNLPFVPTLLLSMVGVALLGVVDRAAGLQAAAPGAARLGHHHRPGCGIFLENFILVIYPLPPACPDAASQHHLDDRRRVHLISCRSSSSCSRWA